jgi:hypothetical protein
MPNYGTLQNSTGNISRGNLSRSAKRVNKLANAVRNREITFTFTGRSGSQRQLTGQWAKILEVAGQKLEHFDSYSQTQRCVSARRLLKLARRLGNADICVVTPEDHRNKYRNWLIVAAQRLLSNTTLGCVQSCLNSVED